MKRVFRISAVVSLGVWLAGALMAQAIAPRTFRAVAGESRVATLSDGVPPMAVITSARTTPALEFPIRVLTSSAPGTPGLSLVIPPATPPGHYTVEVAGRGLDGRVVAIEMNVTVDPMTFSQAAVANRPPVILLNGFQLICTETASTLAASVNDFGQMASLLQSDGLNVSYFNNCTYGDISIEQLAIQLSNYIAALRYTDGTPVTQVDVVTHSMGGLIVRAYLSGKQQASGLFLPPANPKIRKFVAIAMPNFGSYQAFYSGFQLSEMALGNPFLWDLNTWNQGRDDLRSVDALGIIGNAGIYGTTNHAADGVVSLTSASLSFVEPDQRTRIVPYCHTTPTLENFISVSCYNNHGIAQIDTPTHLTAQIVRSFLADTTAWQSIGTTPSTDPFLSRYGSALVAVKSANDAYLTDVTAVSFDNAAGSLTVGPDKTVALYYSEFLAAGQHTFSLTHTSGPATTGTGSLAAGSGHGLLLKSGPVITSVQSATGGLAGLTVASGSNITVNGSGFSGAGTQLTANGAGLSILSLADQQIMAFLPASYNGLVQLKVSNANGQHTVNIMTSAAAAGPAISLSSSQASFVYTLGASAPIAQTISISNVGGGTLSWSASSNSSWLTVSPSSGTGGGTLTLGIATAGLTAQIYHGTITVAAVGAANSPQTISVAMTVNAGPVSPVVVSAVVNAASWAGGPVAPGEIVVLGGLMLGPAAGVTGTVDPSTGKLVSQLAGTTVFFDGVAAPLLYSSAGQVNAVVPYEVAGCTQTILQVQYQGVRSVGQALPCASAAPGIFTFNAQGTGQAAASNQDSTYNGPSSPAAKGSYVTLYFTGGGLTNPAGVTGSINGSTILKWLTQGVSVTVGGVAAAVSFDGAAPTFVDGALQLNIQLSGSTPTGSALPVVVKVGNATSSSTPTLAVR